MTASKSPPEMQVWEGEPIPSEFEGNIGRGLAFSAVIIGVTKEGFGFRSQDERLGAATMEELFRQQVLCRVEHPGVMKNQIKCRLMRVEPCRKDPAYLYFGTANFVDHFNVEEFATQAGLTLFASDRPHRPTISRPPAPPNFGAKK